MLCNACHSLRRTDACLQAFANGWNNFPLHNLNLYETFLLKFTLHQASALPVKVAYAQAALNVVGTRLISPLLTPQTLRCIFNIF